MGDLETKILAAIKEKQATIGVAIIYNGNNILTINNNVHYPLLSVFKFHQALALSNYLQINNIPLSSTVNIQKSDLPENTYSPLRDKYPAGDINLSIYELLKYTLQLSDNNACDILFNKFVTPIQTDNYIKSLGIYDFSISQTEKDMHDNLNNCYKNWSTPLAVAQLVEKFVNGNIISGHYHDSIKKIMIECGTGQDRLKRFLPSDKVQIGHKTGTGDKNEQNKIIGLNDIGFVFLPDNNRYTIVVLIKDSSESFQDTARIIADISRTVFSHFMNKCLP